MFVQPPLSEMGTCLPHESLSLGKRQPWPQAQAGAAPGEANICFLSVNPQTEECGVTTCVAPWGGSCVWRDGGMSPFGCAIYFLNICGRKQEPGGGMWGQGWAGRAGQQSIGRGSAGDGGAPALPSRPMCPCNTQPEPSSATSLMDGEGGCGSPSWSLASFPGSAICLDAAGHTRANHCLHKKLFQREWARSHQDQGFANFNCKRFCVMLTSIKPGLVCSPAPPKKLKSPTK